jgi:anti-sigma factor RsiW
MYRTCDEVRESLSEFVDGSLALDARAALEAHLAGCVGCRAEAAGLRDLVGLLRRVPAAAVPEQLGRRIAEALANEPAPIAIACDEAEDYFTGRLEADLDAWEAGAVAAHLAACSGCRRRLVELEATVSLLRACPRPPAPVDLEPRVLVALAAADEPPLPVRAPVPPPRPRQAWTHMLAGLGGAAVACAALLVWTWLPGVGVPSIETAAVSVRQDVAVNIAFDLDERVEGVVFQVDLPEGLQFIDERSQPMLAQSVSWRGSLEKGRTVVPIVVRGVRPGRYAIEAYVRKGPLRRRTTVLLPVEG